MVHLYNNDSFIHLYIFYPNQQVKDNINRNSIYLYTGSIVSDGFKLIAELMTNFFRIWKELWMS